MNFSVQSSNAKWMALILLLALENIWIFHRHYFEGFAFPWDFLATYHAVTYYWIEAAKLGASLDWVPFQGMGYPTYLNLQSALFYPPMWLLVFLDLDYSLSVAVLMQGLHVGFGALGAAMCARLMGLRWGASLLAGVFYQGFGAFYSNSEHVDIVRAYALLPWLACVAFAKWRAESAWLKTLILMQPLLVYCLWTGGYPGGAVAVLFTLGLVTATRTAWHPEERLTGLRILLVYGIGSVLASPFLLPPAMDISEIARSSLQGRIDYDYMAALDVFSLIYPVDMTNSHHEISMRSIYIGLPAVALLLWGGTQVRRCDPWVAITVLLALAVASGGFHQFLISIFSPLGFSRFVFADYRGIIGLGLILLACQFIDKFPQHPRGGLWVALLLLFVMLGNQAMQLNQTTFDAAVSENNPWANPEVVQLMAILLCVVFLIYFVLKRFPRSAIALIFIVFLLDWNRVHKGQDYFSLPEGQERFESGIGNFQEVQAVLHERLRDGIKCRPDRMDIPQSHYKEKPWRGYYTGDYMMEDYAGPMHLVRQQNILSSPALRSFALLPWRAIAFSPGETINLQELHVATPSKAMSCLHYGVSDLSYQINSADPILVIENESYAKGWRATLFNDQGTQMEVIEPRDINGFRAWVFPAGQFRMEATYQTPHRITGYALSALGLLAWLLFAATSLRRKTPTEAQ